MAPWCLPGGKWGVSPTPPQRSSYVVDKDRIVLNLTKNDPKGWKGKALTPHFK